MPNDLMSVTKGTFVRHNKESGEIEVVDEKTGEVIARQGRLDKYISNLKEPFDPVIADIFCNRIIEGESVRKICEDPLMPDLATLTRWRRNDDDFRKDMAQARKDRAQVYHDKALEIVEETTTKDEVSINRLKSDTYKWAAERGNAEEFGARPTKVEGVSVSTQIIVTGVPQPDSLDAGLIDITATVAGGDELVNEAASDIQDVITAVTGDGESGPVIGD